MGLPTTDSQRRNLAILFSDLCDSTHISGQLEPEQFAALLEAMRAIYDTVVERHGGLIVRIDGDGLLCAFGYPEARDDAARRATEAALDLHREVEELDRSNAFAGASVRLHSGVHAGTVLVREGDMVRGRIEILGDATNLAARLCDHAGPDQVVVSLSSLSADRHFFESEAELAVPIKGRKAPVPALLVVGRSKVGTRFDARNRQGAAPFIGRREQLGELRSAIAKVRDGAVQRVVVWGQPGIGKTRLLGKVLDDAGRAGFNVCRGYCEAYLGTRPLQPFEQIARALWAQSPSDVAQLPDRLLDWVRDTAAQPTVLAIDDWQWADDASRALLEDIVAARPGNLLVILLSRPDGVQPGVADADLKIELGPLSPQESEQAIAGLLRAADPFSIEKIRELAGGSPLYIEELCQAPSAGSVVDLGNSGNDSGAWLDALVQKRYLALPDRQAEIVRTASVMGQIIPLVLFSAVTGVDPTDPLLDELSERDFLHLGEVEGTLRFKHALTRDAIYRLVGLDERKRIHAAVAGQLEAMAESYGEDLYVDALAYHHSACGNEHRAFECALKAGDRALAVAALDRAQMHYRYALDRVWKLHPGSDADKLRSDLIHKYGLSTAVDPVPEQVEVFEATIREAGRVNDQTALCNATYWLGASFYGIGRSREAIDSLSLCSQLCRKAGIKALAIPIEAVLGQAYVRTGQFDEAIEHLDRAIGHRLEHRSPRSDSGLAYAMGCKAQVLSDRGDFDEAKAVFDQAHQVLGDRLNSVTGSLLVKRGAAFVEQGLFDQAIALAAKSVEFNSRIRSRFNLVYSQAISAYSRYMLEPNQAAIEDIVAAAEWFTTSGSEHSASRCYSWAATMFLNSSDFERARHWADLAQQRNRQEDRCGAVATALVFARLSLLGLVDKSPQFYFERAYLFARRRKSRQEWAKIAAAQFNLGVDCADSPCSQELGMAAIRAFEQMEMPYYLSTMQALA